MSKEEKYKKALEEISKLVELDYYDPEEVEYWDSGNLDDAYSSGIETGKYYAAKIAERALNE